MSAPGPKIRARTASRPEQIEPLPSKKVGEAYKCFAERRLQVLSSEISSSVVPNMYRVAWTTPELESPHADRFQFRHVFHLLLTLIVQSLGSSTQRDSARAASFLNCSSLMPLR
jgi:hypothetical protein